MTSMSIVAAGRPPQPAQIPAKTRSAPTRNTRSATSELCVHHSRHGAVRTCCYTSSCVRWPITSETTEKHV